MITEDQLRQIEERCNSASEGPWAKKHGLGEVWMEDCGDDDCALAFMDRGKNEYEENADFIAHARTDVPALIAEVRRLRGELERAKTCQIAWTEQVAVEVLDAVMVGLP